MSNSSKYADLPVKEQQRTPIEPRGINKSNASYTLATLTENQITEASLDSSTYTQTALNLARQASIRALEQLNSQMHLIDPNYIGRTAATSFEISHILNNESTVITDNRTVSFQIGSKDISHTQLLRMLKTSERKPSQQLTKHAGHISGPIPSTFDARTPAETPNGQVIDCT